VTIQGDTDLSVVGRLVGEPARARLLLALADGRRLPVTTLALEAGVATSTASGHLSKLLDGGLVTVTEHGRFRYYRLAGPHVGELIEVMARLAPSRPITSLREGTRAHAMRSARRCYDHLAGRLAVALTATFLDQGFLSGHDGTVDFRRMTGDRPAGGVLDPAAYTLTDRGAEALRALGAAPPVNRSVRCCVDWTEQRHHMAGAVGRALLSQFEQRGWLTPMPHCRALVLTDTGRQGVSDWVGVSTATIDSHSHPSFVTSRNSS
jgi:DNA-binding transcriptional ArsR family regulator